MGMLALRVVAALTCAAGATFVLILIQIGTHFHLAIDEGIYLEGARRTAQNHVAYRDFFALTGPGDFWLHGSLFRIFGPSLAISRAALSCELTLICTAIYWLATRFTTRLFAAAIASLYLAMLLTSPYQLYVNHRWDSNTLSVLAVASLGAGIERQQRKYFLFAGILAGSAAWATPPVGIAVVAILVWMLFQPALRIHALSYCSGVAGISAAAVGILLYQGALAPMVQHLLWSAGNYRSPNSVPYGYLSGDVSQVLAGGRTAVRTAEGMLPTVLPPLAYAGWLLLLWRRKKEIAHVRTLAGLIVVVSAAMLAACYPRFGGHQLLFVSPLYWVLCACALFLAIPAAWLTISSIALLVAAAALWIGAAPPRLPYRIQTQAGEVECSKKHYVLLSGLQRRIQPGDSLFVFPYLPMVYFVTGGKNPTRYSFMQPGMMNAGDEASVIADLRAHPPKWIVWHDFSDARIMSNWPNTDPARLHFLGIERFFAENYRVVNAGEAASVGYRLLTPR